MITVEIARSDRIDEGWAHVEIYLDAKGLDELIRQLRHLQAGESHSHLKSPAWAGNELDETRRGEPSNTLVHHLKIIRTDAIQK